MNARRLANLFRPLGMESERLVQCLFPNELLKPSKQQLRKKKNPKWATEFCAAMVREVKSAFASKPVPSAEPKPSREKRGGGHGETSMHPLRASGVVK